MIASSWKKTIRFATWGALGAGVAELASELLVHHSRASFFRVVGEVGLWFGIIGAAIALSISVAQNYYSRRRFALQKSLVSVTGLGFAGGFVSGAVAQIAYSLTGPAEVHRAICWGIAGGFLGLALSSRIPNLGRAKGLIGGFVGGLLGGGSFIVLTTLFGQVFGKVTGAMETSSMIGQVVGRVTGAMETSSMIGQVVGRVTGVMITGLMIGFMISILELVLREAWLEVHYGPNEIRMIGIGQDPILFGSSSECHIYLPRCQGSPTILASVRTVSGTITYEDRTNGKSTSLRNGSQFKIGNLTINVKAK